MATLVTYPRRSALAPQAFDWALSAIAGALLAAVAAALVLGSSDWSRVPGIVWAHVLTIAVALALTPVMLLRKRGDYPHRVIGWVWVSSMMLTAVLSFWIRGINGASLSWIHILSVVTLIQAPRIVLTARRHEHVKHRAAVRALITRALAIAGMFTLIPSRLLGHWLFG